ESQGLCRSPSAVSHNPDSVRGVFRSARRSKVRLGVLRRVGSLLVLLAVDSVSCALRIRVARRPARMFGAVSVSNEHGEGAASRDYLPRDCNLPVFQKEILAVIAAGPCLH